MKSRNILDIIILGFLLVGSIIINNHKYYFKLIYSSVLLYNIFILYSVKKNEFMYKNKILWIIFASIFSYFFSYFIIYDQNPIISIITYYIIFPDFFKGIIIILFHSYFFSKYCIKQKYNYINNLNYKYDSIKFKKYYIYNRNPNYFLSDVFKYFKRDKYNFNLSLILIFLFFSINLILFVNRIKIWVYFNKKEKTLPISTSQNTIFYITGMIADMEGIIINFIEEMKKLINYLGKDNVILSIVENGDSKDNTRDYLKEFKIYLDKNKITNKFILRKEIKDPRKNSHPFIKNGPLRIKYYSMLRNKCFDLMYEIPNLNFDNTKIIFFNDIYYKYEDIINLISTNNEDYDAVCGLDFDDSFYDRWVSIDLDGNSLLMNFPFIVNKEAQDLILSHKPFRVFSCWNGVTVFTASPFKNKTLQFRYKENNETRKYKINNCQDVDYESECTYFHIDLFNLGYTKKFINPDVRVTYEFQYYFKRKYYYPFFKDIKSYFYLYFKSFLYKRNKFMSDYKYKKVKFNSMLENWYFENKKKSGH